MLIKISMGFCHFLCPKRLQSSIGHSKQPLLFSSSLPPSLPPSPSRPLIINSHLFHWCMHSSIWRHISVCLCAVSAVTLHHCRMSGCPNSSHSSGQSYKYLSDCHNWSHHPEVENMPSTLHTRTYFSDRYMYVMVLICLHTNKTVYMYVYIYTYVQCRCVCYMYV